MRKVRYCVVPFTTRHLYDTGQEFANFKEATDLAKREALVHGSALIKKTVWEADRIIKYETGILRADGRFQVITLH
jgi:hypothetical protein